MVAEHVEDDFESVQVFLDECSQPDILGVADVSYQRQVLHCWIDFEDIIR